MNSNFSTPVLTPANSSPALSSSSLESSAAFLDHPSQCLGHASAGGRKAPSTPEVEAVIRRVTGNGTDDFTSRGVLPPGFRIEMKNYLHKFDQSNWTTVYPAQMDNALVAHLRDRIPNIPGLDYFRLLPLPTSHPARSYHCNRDGCKLPFNGNVDSMFQHFLRSPHHPDLQMMFQNELKGLHGGGVSCHWPSNDAQCPPLLCGKLVTPGEFIFHLARDHLEIGQYRCPLCAAKIIEPEDILRHYEDCWTLEQMKKDVAGSMIPRMN